MKTINTLLLVLGLSAFAHIAFASRMAPAEIAAITTKRGAIQHSFERSNIGFNMYVLMKDKAGDLRWKTKIFSRKYEKNLETDVQDIHLRSLTLEAPNVVAIDEMGRRYEVDMNTGNLTKPLKPADYSVKN